MIVRILGEGKFKLDDSCLSDLESFDNKLVEAIDEVNGVKFEEALGMILSFVRSNGEALGPENFDTSDLALPHEGTTLEEMKELLAEGA